jgi:hypothetical protein
MSSQRSIELPLGVLTGTYPVRVVMFTGLVLKLKWSFKTDHSNKLTYWKDNKQNICDK